MVLMVVAVAEISLQVLPVGETRLSLQPRQPLLAVQSCLALSQVLAKEPELLVALALALDPSALLLAMVTKPQNP